MSIEICPRDGTRPHGNPLDAEWWELWRRDPQATPFQSPAWLIPWRRHFDDGEDCILTVRRDGALTALLPLFRAEGRYLLWGSGTSDWLDGVFDPSLDAGELTDALSQLDAPLDLFQIRAGSPLLAAPAPAGWRDERRESAPCVRAALPTAPGKKLRQNINYSRRRAERCGLGKPVRLSPECIDRLAELHARRWQERGEPGVFADPRVLDHHRDALPELEAAGLSRLYGLCRDDGEPMAVLYMLWGHPDHDATAFCVRAAAWLLRNGGHKSPVVIEAPFYRLRDGQPAYQEFAAAPEARTVDLRASRSEIEVKRRMLSAFASQKVVLEPMRADLEPLRFSTPQDFSALPNGGALLYERFGWCIDGPNWLQLAAGARRELGVPAYL